MNISFVQAFNETLLYFKITAKDMSARSGVRESTISEFRTGKSEARISTLEALVNALPDEARNYMFFKALLTKISNRDVRNFLQVIALTIKDTEEITPNETNMRELVKLK